MLNLSAGRARIADSCLERDMNSAYFPVEVRTHRLDSCLNSDKLPQLAEMAMAVDSCLQKNMHLGCFPLEVEGDKLDGCLDSSFQVPA